MRELGFIKKVLILAIILILPGFLYYLLTEKGKNRYHPLPIYGPKTLSGTYHKVKGKKIPDTIFHKLDDFQLHDQGGKQVSLKTFDNKIFVANFFYTNCPTVCNQMNSFVDSLAENYAKNKMVYFASITVDPQRDTQKTLYDYSRKFDAHGPKWLFLTGDTATIYHLARTSLLVDALDEGQGNYIYSGKLILVDSHKRIRGYYSGASLRDVKRLNDEIKVLVQEELLNRETPLY